MEAHVGEAAALEGRISLGEGHQRWQLNEINALIWPAPKGIGVMDNAQDVKTNVEGYSPNRFRRAGPHEGGTERCQF